MVENIGIGFKSILQRFKTKVFETAEMAKKIGENDPRKIVHSMKVGLALSFVSLLYYFRPLYHGFGVAGMWAIMTVVVVFEFTVGGTLSKGLNRVCATLLAASLGLGAEYLAGLCGDKPYPFILGFMVFIIATVSTFIRFFPSVKKKYDYGVMIFILTFSLVAVSGFRVNQIVQLAHQRLSTILIGGATCMTVSIFVCPVWAGQDLHNLIATNIEKLATILEGFGGTCLIVVGIDEGGGSTTSCPEDEDKTFLLGCQSVVNSKAAEESLANFAWWEPPHGGFGFHHPWKHYLKIGAIARECASHIQSLGGYINNSKPHVASEFHGKLEKLCLAMSQESGKALIELVSSMKNLKFPSPAVATHIQNSKSASDDLKNMLENFVLPKQDLQEFMQALVVAYILFDIIKCVDKISALIQELSKTAHFKNQNS